MNEATGALPLLLLLVVLVDGGGGVGEVAAVEEAGGATDDEALAVLSASMSGKTEQVERGLRCLPRRTASAWRRTMGSTSVSPTAGAVAPCSKSEVVVAVLSTVAGLARLILLVAGGEGTVALSVSGVEGTL